MHGLPFRRVAILPPQFGDAEAVLAWANFATAHGADALLLRWPQALPPTPILLAVLQSLARIGTAPRLLRTTEIPDREVLALVNGIHFPAFVNLPAATDLPDNKWLGRSCHTADEVTAAQIAGCHYAFLSPIFATATHPNAAPLGLERFSQIAKATTLPLFALGGITPENEPQCRAAGAWGVAAIGLFGREGK